MHFWHVHEVNFATGSIAPWHHSSHLSAPQCDPSSVGSMHRLHPHSNFLSLARFARRSGVGSSVSAYEMVMLSPFLISSLALSSCANPSAPRSARPSTQRKVFGTQSWAAIATSGKEMRILERACRNKCALRNAYRLSRRQIIPYLYRRLVALSAH